MFTNFETRFFKPNPEKTQEKIDQALYEMLRELMESGDKIVLNENTLKNLKSIKYIDNPRPYRRGSWALLRARVQAEPVPYLLFLDFLRTS